MLWVLSSSKYNPTKKCACKSCCFSVNAAFTAFSQIVLGNVLMLHHNCPYSLCHPLRFGDISLQERINQKNFEMLEAYYKSLSEKVPVECECRATLACCNPTKMWEKEYWQSFVNIWFFTFLSFDISAAATSKQFFINLYSQKNTNRPSHWQCVYVFYGQVYHVFKHKLT